MTTEQLKDLRDAIDATLAGKLVQIEVSPGVWNDCRVTEYSALAFTRCYRAKPEPITRPWNKETIPDLPFGVIVKRNGNKMTVVCANDSEIWLGGVESRMDYDELMRNYTRNDGSPCGSTE